MHGGPEGENAMDKYPIGFWNYAALGRGGDDVDDWAELGVTVAMTPRFVEGESSKEDMIALLDRAHEKGMKCILFDMRLLDWWPLKYDGERLRKYVAQVTEDFGSHPALMGYHVTDEPGVHGPEEVKNSIAACRMIKEAAPHLKHFLNLNPWHMTGPSTSGLMNRPHKRYVDVLEEYAKEAGLDFLSYDCYSQMKPGESGFNMYFRNLEMYREAAGRCSIPFWTTLLCTEHYNYRAPTLNDYRWQVNTAAAHGCKGILWFQLYPSWPGSNPYSLSGRKRESFYDLADVHKVFLDRYADILLHSELEEVWHVNRTFGGVQLFEDWADPLCFASGTDWDKGLILSRFRHEDGSLYYAMTNLSAEKADNMHMYFCCDGFSYHEISENGTPREKPSGTEARRTDSGGSWDNTLSVKIGGWFLPGEMKMWKAVPKEK